MVAIHFLGTIGLGLVWGWLIGRVVYGQPLRNVPYLIGATLILGAEVLVFIDWRAVLVFFGATGFALLFHSQWRRELREQFGPPKNH